MTWRPMQELVKKARVIASGQHPEGFNKQQLVDASEAVYGGFGVVMASNGLRSKPIRTMEDVGNMGNAMANIDGRYPLGMSGCLVVGLNGGCGPECPVYLESKCDVPHDQIERLDSEEELERHYEMYGKPGEGGS